MNSKNKNRLFACFLPSLLIAMDVERFIDLISASFLNRNADKSAPIATASRVRNQVLFRSTQGLDEIRQLHL